MSTNEIRAVYAEVKQAANMLSQYGERAQQVEADLRSCFQSLHGEWVGFGSASFFGEMDQLIFPAFNRLSAALEEARLLLDKISEEFEQTEESDARRITQLESGLPTNQTGQANFPNLPSGGMIPASYPGDPNQPPTVDRDIITLGQPGMPQPMTDGGPWFFIENMMMGCDENGCTTASVFTLPTTDELNLLKVMLADAALLDGDYEGFVDFLKDMGETFVGEIPVAGPGAERLYEYLVNANDRQLDSLYNFINEHQGKGSPVEIVVVQDMFAQGDLSPFENNKVDEIWRPEYGGGVMVNPGQSNEIHYLDNDTAAFLNEFLNTVYVGSNPLEIPDRPTPPAEENVPPIYEV